MPDIRSNSSAGGRRRNNATPNSPLRACDARNPHIEIALQILYKPTLLMRGQMAWTDMIAGCFGFGTAPFASNPPDQDSAKKAIRAAKAEGATRAEFAHTIAMYPRKYIKSEHVLRERLKEDGYRLEKLWKPSRS
jgi:hypothetical protein